MLNPIKEIRSRDGVLHFRRYKILETRWFNLYIHRFYKGDQDEHLHDHPWDFRNLVIWNGYLEQNEKEWIIKPSWTFPLFKKRKAEYAHKIHHTFGDKPTTTLVLTGPRRREWGYHTEDGWMNNEDYRKWKHEQGGN